MKLAVNTPGDSFELEADRIADSVTSGAKSAVQRTISRGGRPASTSSPEGLTQAGRPLDRATRAFMESGIGADFASVRVHDSPLASESARSLDALAYTVGSHIVFRDGYCPETVSGRRLIAHELVHTVQQQAAAPSVMRQHAHKECAPDQDGKWIDRIVVDQSTPQTVTVHWRKKDGSDGGTDHGPCSTGKGRCCVEPGSAAEGACSVAKSRRDDTNCTPIAHKNVLRHIRDHKGVEFWTEIDTDRAIALHEYAPVDSTPLSHGCLRLHHDMAFKIFCGSIAHKTTVDIVNVARPMCDHPKLQQEWMNDFRMAATDPMPPDGESRREVLEARSELESAFGGKSHTAAQYAEMTHDDIPRCKTPHPSHATTHRRHAGKRH